jgi:uncharacterized protein
MRFTMDPTAAPLSVRRYDDNGVVIGERLLTRPFVVTADRLIAEWTTQPLAALQVADLDPVFALDIELLLIGTRAAERIAPLAIRRLCRARGLALESMELGAACRTFNVLLAEGRLVGAALFP